MGKRKIRMRTAAVGVVVAGVVVGFGAWALVAAGASAESEPHRTPGAVVKDLEKPAEDVREYWTEERMRNAEGL